MWERFFTSIHHGPRRITYRCSNVLKRERKKEILQQHNWKWEKEAKRIERKKLISISCCSRWTFVFVSTFKCKQNEIACTMGFYNINWFNTNDMWNSTNSQQLRVKVQRLTLILLSQHNSFQLTESCCKGCKCEIKHEETYAHRLENFCS